MPRKGNGKLRIIPLGGLNEIGKNMTVIEYDNDMIVVDCGVSFPDDDMPGIDLVIPDTTYVETNIEKLRGIVLTHGHEDHIGAIPYVLRTVNTPVYGTRLTLGIIENKLAEQYAENYELLRFAGSDNHSGEKQKLLGGMATDRPIESVKDFIDLVLSGEAHPFKKEGNNIAYL